MTVRLFNRDRRPRAACRDRPQRFPSPPSRLFVRSGIRRESEGRKCE